MESYIVSAWNIFMQVITFMSTTSILTVGGISITFLDLLVTTVLVSMFVWVVYELLGV